MRADFTVFPDVTASESDYVNLQPDQSLIASDGYGRTAIFHTLQGEGPFAGRPATFVRLAGCNLGGKGANGPGCMACDTDFRLHNGMTMRFHEIVDAIKQAIAFDRAYTLFTGKKQSSEGSLVVITGGEPLLQPTMPNLVNYLLDEGFAVQIESNGMVPRVINGAATLVVSPKVPSNREDYLPLPPAIFERADFLKMVVTANTDDPHNRLPDWVFEFSKRMPVYISPLAVYRKVPQKYGLGPSKRHSDIITSVWSNDTYDNEQCAANYSYAAELCIKYGFWLSVQMHILAVIP